MELRLQQKGDFYENPHFAARGSGGALKLPQRVRQTLSGAFAAYLDAFLQAFSSNLSLGKVRLLTLPRNFSQIFAVKCQKVTWCILSATNVGRIAGENVVVELLKAKCLPCLYYGLEACPINKSQIRYLEFVLNNIFRKIFCCQVL